MTDTKLIKVSEAEYNRFILSIARPNTDGTARVVADVPYVRQDGPTQIAEYRADGRVIARHTSAMNRGSSYYITSPRFDAAGNLCQLAYTPAGETRWTPTKDGVLIDFCGKGCTVKSAAQLIGWSDVAKRANDNPDFAAPWFACLGYQYADFAAHWESRGYDFPCTSEQFRARVAEYAGDNQSLAEVLINQGGAT